MDALINAAVRALAAGYPLGELNRVALRDDAPALQLQLECLTPRSSRRSARSVSLVRLLGYRQPHTLSCARRTLPRERVRSLARFGPRATPGLRPWTPHWLK